MEYQSGKLEGGDNLDQNVNVVNCFDAEGVPYFALSGTLQIRTDLRGQIKFF